MNEQEKLAFEKELREKIADENLKKQRERKAAWREKNREHIRQYDKIYRMRKKLMREVTSHE